NTANKKDWFEIGRYLAKGIRIEYHNEMKLSAQRTYQYYSIRPDDWNGPSPRSFGKMNKDRFTQLLNERQQIQELELTSSPKVEEDQLLPFSPIPAEESCEQLSFHEGEDLSRWNLLMTAAV